MKNKVLLVTDSLAFPRSTPEKVNYEETYLCQLKSTFINVDFIHVGYSGVTTGDLMNLLVAYWDTLQPDIIIFHCGIVDCAPRALTKIEGQIVRRIPVFNKIIGKIVKKNSKFLRKKRKITYTSPLQFKKYLTEIINHFNTAKTIAIEIAPIPDIYEEKAPGIKLNQTDFNNILKEIGISYVTSAGLNEKDLMSDLHHLNKEGHEKVFNSLKEIINNLD